jgi:hypothetical protein
VRRRPLLVLEVRGERRTADAGFAGFAASPGGSTTATPTLPSALTSPVRVEARVTGEEAYGAAAAATPIARARLPVLSDAASGSDGHSVAGSVGMSAWQDEGVGVRVAWEKLAAAHQSPIAVRRVRDPRRHASPERVEEGGFPIRRGGEAHTGRLRGAGAPKAEVRVERLGRVERVERAGAVMTAIPSPRSTPLMRVSSLLRWMRTPRCAVSRLMCGCAPRSVSGHKRAGGAW